MYSVAEVEQMAQSAPPPLGRFPESPGSSSSFLHHGSHIRCRSKQRDNNFYFSTSLSFLAIINYSQLFHIWLISFMKIPKGKVHVLYFLTVLISALQTFLSTVQENKIFWKLINWHLSDDRAMFHNHSESLLCNFSGVNQIGQAKFSE